MTTPRSGFASASTCSSTAGWCPGCLIRVPMPCGAGRGRGVTDPYHELVDDLHVLRLGWRHRWQTKVGPPERPRIRDWMTLDLEASFFPERRPGQLRRRVRTDWRRVRLARWGADGRAGGRALRPVRGRTGTVERGHSHSAERAGQPVRRFPPGQSRSDRQSTRRRKLQLRDESQVGVDVWNAVRRSGRDRSGQSATITRIGEYALLHWDWDTTAAEQRRLRDFDRTASGWIHAGFDAARQSVGDPLTRKTQSGTTEGTEETEGIEGVRQFIPL